MLWISFRGLHKLHPRPLWSLLGVKFNISDKHPCPFHMGVPPSGLGGPSKLPALSLSLTFVEGGRSKFGIKRGKIQVFYAAFLTISWLKPRSIVTNYSGCIKSNSAYRDAYITRPQTQGIVCLCSNIRHLCARVPKVLPKKMAHPHASHPGLSRAWVQPV